MADTLPNIELPEDVWVELYSGSGIAAGTRILIENIGSKHIQIVAQASEPTADPAGFVYIRALDQKANESGDSGVWARSSGRNGLVNVKEFE